MLAQSDEIASGTISPKVHALFANDDYGMVLVTVRAERHGRRFEDRQVHVYTLHVYTLRDGRIAEFGCSRAIGRLMRSSGPSDR